MGDYYSDGAGSRFWLMSAMVRSASDPRRGGERGREGRGRIGTSLGSRNFSLGFCYRVWNLSMFVSCKGFRREHLGSGDLPL